MNRSAIGDLFRACVNHPKLFWEASNTGCEAKADLMAEIAEERGHDVSKIWIHPASAGGQFPVYLNRAKSERTRWNYHVAIAVKTRDGAVSDSEVIDPTLFQEPVNVAEWIRVASLLAAEYDQSLLVTESPRHAFYGPDDIVSSEGRARALERREAILTNASNLNDPVIFGGCLMKRRGDFVDGMMRTNPVGFQKLESLLIMGEFRDWFCAPLSVQRMVELLGEHPRYYGVDSAEILARVDRTDVLASFELKKALWAEVGRAIRRLRERVDALNLGRWSPEASLFRTLWKDAMYRARWFSPFEEAEWRSFGLDPERIASPSASGTQG
ncbi:MAG: hypothetical protein ACI9F9_002478 [Candidatus Paceibacteria bacterium]|jgi:hypothetical protein